MMNQAKGLEKCVLYTLTRFAMLLLLGCSCLLLMGIILLYKLQCVIGILATEKCRIRTRVLISYQTCILI